MQRFWDAGCGESVENAGAAKKSSAQTETGQKLCLSFQTKTPDINGKNKYISLTAQIKNTEEILKDIFF